MPPRSLLLVAHISPPATMSAARRVAGLTRHLARLGHRVTVLTSVVSGSGPVDGACRTIRTRDLMVSRFNWRAGSFRALQGGGSGAYEPAPSALAAYCAPDLQLAGWLPFALPRALAAASRERPDCVITTSPPHSGHLIGVALSRAGIPWVADFRDAWVTGPGRPDFALAPDALDRALERLVVRRADTVVSVTRPIAADFTARHGVPVTTITNGFDPLEGSGAGAAPPLDPGRVSLVHTGSLAYAGTSPGPLLDALKRLAPAEADRLEIVFAGPTSAAERAAMADPALAGRVRAAGTLSRPDVLALQRAADALLVIVRDDRPDVATGKLYEYLAAHKPILVLGTGTEAARLVAETGAGLAVSARDVDGIAAALRRLLGGEVPAPAPGAVERFSYARLAEEMAGAVETAIARHPPQRLSGLR
jgi:glycosyltransferase involved in cell wall biosynthesis